METSYFSSDYRRGRHYAPYHSFGAAMPMRFCDTDGSLLDVYQQHTQIADDVLFAHEADYSYHFTAEAFAAIADRMCRDACARFHTPIGACIHPSNRPKFSRDADTALLDAAARHGMAIWSFTQWCRFWMDRERCTISEVHWSGGVLRFSAENGSSRDDLRIALPTNNLESVRVNGNPITCTHLVPLSPGRATIEATYRKAMR